MSGPGQAAIAFAKSGLRVLPLNWVVGAVCSCGNPTCQQIGKHPYAPFARSGVYSATSDLLGVQEWWTRCPEANVGIALGQYDSRFLIGIDLDRKGGRDGWESFQRLLADHALPARHMVRTPSGGLHLYFWSSRPVDTSKDQLGPGIEVYCKGRYIIAPPSVTPSGSYILAETSTSGITDIPGWLPELLAVSQRPTPSTTKALEQPASFTRAEPDLEDVIAWSRYAAFVERILNLRGLLVGVRFQPWWRDASGNTAQVTIDKRGLYICFDNGTNASPRSMTIPELYAAIKTGTARRLGPKEAVLWAKRAQVELGYRTLPPLVGPPVPDDLTDLETALFKGFLLRWQLRLDEPEVAFSCSFAARWIHPAVASKSAIGSSLKRLRARGLLHKASEKLVGKTNPMYLYSADGDFDLSVSAREGSAVASPGL